MNNIAPKGRAGIDDEIRPYRAILPDLAVLGLRANLTPPLDPSQARFLVTISGSPAVNVRNDGTWARQDGHEGDGPKELLELYRSERAESIERHLTARDWKHMAEDMLVFIRQDAGSVLEASYHAGDDTLHAIIRTRGSGTLKTRFTHPERRLRAVIQRLRKEQE